LLVGERDGPVQGGREDEDIGPAIREVEKRGSSADKGGGVLNFCDDKHFGGGLGQVELESSAVAVRDLERCCWRHERCACWRFGLANVAVLTRESPSAARVSSAFNTQLGGALHVRAIAQLSG
jgi:hypothetical protein